jgi:hypothetical protein
LVLRKKELDYLKNEMTWRDFADAAGATVLIRGLIRGSSKKISTTTKKKVQQSIALTMAGAGRNALVKDALKEIRKALAKNGPPIVDKLTGKGVRKAKVSKRAKTGGSDNLQQKRQIKLERSASTNLIVDISNDLPRAGVFDEAELVAVEGADGVVGHKSKLAGWGHDPHEVGPRLRQRPIARARERSPRHDANEDRPNLLDDGRALLAGGIDVERAFDWVAPVSSPGVGRLCGLLGGLLVEDRAGRGAHYAFRRRASAVSPRPAYKAWAAPRAASRRGRGSRRDG